MKLTFGVTYADNQYVTIVLLIAQNVGILCVLTVCPLVNGQIAFVVFTVMKKPLVIEKNNVYFKAECL